MQDDVVIAQVRFGVDTSLGPYQDWLYYPIEKWPVDAKTLAADKQALADTWVAFMTQQLADQAALQTQQGLQDKIGTLQAQIDELTAEQSTLQKSLASVQVQPMPSQPADVIN